MSPAPRRRARAPSPLSPRGAALRPGERLRQRVEPGRAILRPGRSLLRGDLRRRHLRQRLHQPPRLGYIVVQLAPLRVKARSLLAAACLLPLRRVDLRGQRIGLRVLRQLRLADADRPGQLIRTRTQGQRGRAFPLRRLRVRRLHGDFPHGLVELFAVLKQRLRLTDALLQRRALLRKLLLPLRLTRLRLPVERQPLPRQLHHRRKPHERVFLRKRGKRLLQLRGHAEPLRVLQKRALGLLRLAPGGVRALAQQPLELRVALRVEDAPEDLPPLLRAREQNPAEIALRDHADLCELVAREADERLHLRRRAAVARRDVPVRVSEHSLRTVFDRALAAHLLPLVFRATAHGVALTAQQERQLHKCGRLRRGVLAAQHGAAACLPAGLAIEREGNRIEDRRLARARVAGNQVQPALAEAVHVDVRPPGVRPERGQRDMQRSHASSSQMRSIMPESSARCAASISCPFCCA